MPKIILKRAVHFIEYKDNIITDANGVKHNRPIVVNDIRVHPSPMAQTVPDWVKLDPHYALLQGDDLLIEVSA